MRSRYQHSLEIHDRIEDVLRLIKKGRYSTPAIAEELGVSIPTISRIVAALRERGHDIQAMRKGSCWHYVLMSDALQENSPSQGQQKATSSRRTGG
jgi:biotin operon repressor